jgi:dihydropteroate synthase
MKYFRPIPMTDAPRPQGAFSLAGGWCWFDRVAVLERGQPARLIAAADVPGETLARLTAPRAMIAGLTLDVPRLMGILNVTPDSFSDGGRFFDPAAALAQARALAAGGADILDIGGESTRPGAPEVPLAEEIARTAPVIAALRAGGMTAPISIDTRKALVAEAALAAGAQMVNDVAAFSFDPAMAPLVAARGVPVCLMHAQGRPATMQAAPHYDDVLLDVYDYLAARLAVTEAAGICKSRIVLDPGLGFGKTLAHNVALLQGMALFHALGCPILLGASRKRFIGTLGQADAPQDRVAGSVAVALAGVAQGVQLLRVHDISETRQAVAVWRAVTIRGKT